MEELLHADEPFSFAIGVFAVAYSTLALHFIFRKMEQVLDAI